MSCANGTLLRFAGGDLDEKGKDGIQGINGFAVGQRFKCDSSVAAAIGQPGASLERSPSGVGWDFVGVDTPYDLALASSGGVSAVSDVPSLVSALGGRRHL